VGGDEIDCMYTCPYLHTLLANWKPAEMTYSSYSRKFFWGPNAVVIAKGTARKLAEKHTGL
jgi:hypothetical protein